MPAFLIGSCVFQVDHGGINAREGLAMEPGLTFMVG